jgi:hypothetical protein
MAFASVLAHRIDRCPSGVRPLVKLEDPSMHLGGSGENRRRKGMTDLVDRSPDVMRDEAVSGRDAVLPSRGSRFGKTA